MNIAVSFRSRGASLDVEPEQHVTYRATPHTSRCLLEHFQAEHSDEWRKTNLKPRDQRKKMRKWMVMSLEPSDFGWTKILMKTLHDTCRESALK
jgi:hypothetical protein